MDLLRIAVDRSIALEILVDAAWTESEVSADPTATASARLCALTLDHGRSIRVLLPEVPPSAIVLLRTQFEALVRAVWARHAATESELARLMAPLTPASQQAARNLPGVTAMLAALEASGPKGAAALLGRARDRLWGGMNSYVHGGIHPLHRGESGYPAQLLTDLLKSSNAFSILTLIVLAEISVDAGILELMAVLHEEFGDILPELEPF
ncbi:DUF6988 family protein [Stenotrophomonas sp. GZD-301]|uniref:DUF6988 family protein n=1 Tax=Stenotrophomonas sp. GZD-301 TaxID=3404814 RepID=UPI003BB5DE58